MLACQRPRKRKVEPIKYVDGKEICVQRTASGRREYKKRTNDMWSRQRGICPICTKLMHSWEATFEHEDGRGAGKHDDRIWKKVDICDDSGAVIEVIKTPYNFAVHGMCNSEKGSKRMTLSREGEI